MKIDKIAVIFIGTDKYLRFLPKWYEECEDKLVPNVYKQYFVFTDGKVEGLPDNVSVYHQEHRPWPYITLLRFSTILKAQEELSKYDWVIFLDADMVVVDTIMPEELFGIKPYIGVHHPCHYLKMTPHNSYPGAFETDERSEAAVDEDDDLSVYFQGCLWGGRIPEVINMMKELDRRTQADLEREYIAQWHDESQMNKFFSERRSDVKVLHPAYAFPEDFSDSCQFEPKIVHVSKDNSKYHK
tara:strand:+ start:582 stop:1307 length:726 start_codon:yes stop_codon:yes gene_type:complete